MVFPSVLPLIDSLDPGTAKASMCLIANELSRLQALASASLSTKITCESELCNTGRPKLPNFALGDTVLFYHHRQVARRNKLATTWLGP